jgi:hypothetical protein
MSAIRTLGAILICAITIVGCAEDETPDASTNPSNTGGLGGVGGSSGSSAAGAGAGSGGMTGVGAAGAAGSSTVPPPVGGGNAPPTAGASGAAGGGSGASGSGGTGGAGTAGMGTAGTASDPMVPPSGPKDGDPSKPIVTVDGIPCGPSMAGLGGGNHEIGGRKLIVDYPCDKHEGAHVTVILNLHGTLIMGAPYSYQHAYFSAHRFVNSHNLIVLTPQSVSTASYGAQWGNMDNGEDIPHLLAVLEWAYTTFAKFQIRGLWVGGHSWGAGFTAATLGGGPFACHPMLADKVKGAIGMSRLAMPSCASRLSLIATRGETENIALLDQTSVAMGHGCTTPMAGPEAVGNNEYRHFADCDPGFVHEDYHMLGKGHIDSMDPEVVEKIVDAIKSTEL